MPIPLKLAISPCPNDTFVFEGVVDGSCLPPAISQIETEFLDVQALNEGALKGSWDIVKVSAAAIPELMDDYWVLPCGGAMGHGCGPLLLASAGGGRFQPMHPVVLPGNLTTAALLYRSWSRSMGCESTNVEFSRFDSVYRGLVSGKIHQGVVIHEHRFTWQKDGLVLLDDLGAFWERTTQSPIPLGVVVCKRSLGTEIAMACTQAIQTSLRKAWARPTPATDFIRFHAQIDDPVVLQSHIHTFVNEFTLDMGETGRRAILALLRVAREFPAPCPYPGKDLPSHSVFAG